MKYFLPIIVSVFLTTSAHAALQTGTLTLPSEEDAARIKTRVLILHGAADRFVKTETIAGLQETLEKAGVDWQMVYYAHAVHAFTNPDAGSDPSKRVAYNAKAAERSWKQMQVFFEEVFTDGRM